MSRPADSRTIERGISRRATAIVRTNSNFYGEKLLTTGNPDTGRDLALFARLGLRPMPAVQADDERADVGHAAGTRGDLTCPGPGATAQPCAA